MGIFFCSDNLQKMSKRNVAKIRCTIAYNANRRIATLFFKKISKKFEFIRFLYTFATSIIILNAFLFSALRLVKNLT